MPPTQRFDLKLFKPARAIVQLGVGLGSISFAPIFIRFSETELSANATVLNRLLIFLVIFGFGQVIGSYFKSSNLEVELKVVEQPNYKQWFLLFSVGVISVTSLVLWALSLAYTTVAKSMLLNNLTPLFTSLGAFVFLGQRFEKRFLLGMVIALTGAISLSFGDLTSDEGLFLGDLYALLSAVFLGTYFLLVEQLRKRFSAITILLWRCAVGSGFLLPMLLMQGEQLFPTTTTACLAVFALGFLCEGLGQRLLADSMAELSSSFVCLFLLLEPVVSALLAWAILGENLAKGTWISFVAVMLGIYLAQSGNSNTVEEQGIGAALDASIPTVALPEEQELLLSGSRFS